MNIHIICPFYRKPLYPILVHYLEPMKIIWHPICDSTDIEPFKNNGKDWIKPLLVPPLKTDGKRDLSTRKLNDFITTQEIIDEDYYGFMGDDDMYEPGFFDVIREQTAKILIVSLSRGDSVPKDPKYPNASPHPVFPLIMRRLEEIQINAIGLPQFILKGEILKQMKFRNEAPCDDGYFAEDLRNKFPDEIKFLTYSFVFGNFFEKGRKK